MDFLYEESFTPWEAPNLEDKCINYLRKPQEINLNHFRQFTTSIRNSANNSRDTKQSRNFFIERNKHKSRRKPSRTQSKIQLKKSHQSIHFSRNSDKRQTNHTQYETVAKQPFHTLTNFAVKRKSLKQKIEKTKKLLEKSQNIKMNEFRNKPLQEKRFQESLHRLLSLSKSHHNLNASQSLNQSTIDNFFLTKNLIKSHQRGKNSCTELSHNKKETLKSDDQFNKSMNFLQSKTNMLYMKKRSFNKTFCKLGKFQKTMNLPKIQILDWEKPEI